MQRGVLLGALLLGCSTAEAGLSVRPSRIAHVAQPGEQVEGRFHLENRAAEPLEVEVQVEDWTGGMGASRVPAPWLSVKPWRVRLRPGRSRTIRYQVRVPEEASGELRAQVFFSTPVIGGAGMRSRLGSVIYVGIAGSLALQADITEAAARYVSSVPQVRQPDQLTVTLGLRNRGNAHVVPQGEVIVRRPDGGEAGRCALPPGWGLLPGKSERYEAVGHGLYLAPGRYQLEAIVRYGSDLQAPAESTRTFDVELTEEYEMRLLESPPPTP